MLCRTHRCGYPVVDNGTLLGMVSIGDINRELFFERGLMRH
ncbi:MAG: hypothetical protein ABL970_05060 [Nitrospira sp.]